MTNQEAIMRIKEHIRIHQIYEPKAIKISEALDMAIPALEKQTPVKAFYDEEQDYVECPICKHLTNAGGFPEGLRYCFSCGQAFDWNELGGKENGID